MNEAGFKKKLKKMVPDKTWTFSPVQTGMGAHGVPDILMCVPTVITQDMVGKTIGRFVAIEAKIHPNKTTPLQDHQLESIAAAGGQALIITGHKDPKKPFTTVEVCCNEYHTRHK